MVITHPEIEIGQSIVLEERGMAEAMQVEVMLDALCELAHALEAGMQALAAEDGSGPTPGPLR
jgi:hypothetical protein